MLTWFISKRRQFDGSGIRARAQPVRGEREGGGPGGERRRQGGQPFHGRRRGRHRNGVCGGGSGRGRRNAQEEIAKQFPRFFQLAGGSAHGRRGKLADECWYTANYGKMAIFISGVSLQNRESLGLLPNRAMDKQHLC